MTRREKAEAVVRCMGHRRFRHANQWGDEKLDFVEWDGKLLWLYHHDGRVLSVTGWSSWQINDALERGNWIEIT